MHQAARAVRSASHPGVDERRAGDPRQARAAGYAALMIGTILVGALGIMLNLVVVAIAGWVGFALALLVGDLLLRARAPTPKQDGFDTSSPPFRQFSDSRRTLSSVRVLVVDDEPAVREAVRRALTFEGYDVLLATEGGEALQLLASESVDVIILDVLMPNVDGMETCRKLRAVGNTTPVLMLTARRSVGDRVAGLDAGADDYLAKPFALEELVARLRALLRRARNRRDVLLFADLVMDVDAHEVRRGQRDIELTQTEFRLVELLLRHPRRVLTRQTLLKRVWGFDFPTTSNTLDVYVGYVRRKLEAGGEPRLVHTVRGLGYVLRAP